MRFSSFTFAGINWLAFAAITLGAGLLLLFWNYRPGSTGGLRWLCLILKALAIATLAFCLLEPLQSGQRARPGANLFAIVADNSLSLQAKDRGDSQPRSQFLRSLLEPTPNGWQAILADHFEVRRFLFDARLQATRDFHEMDFAGRASAIGSALRTVRERFQGHPLAGVLLLTDGNATDLRSAADLYGLPPVYPVVIGRPGSAKDLALVQVTVTQSAFEDAPVSIQADASATGLSGETVIAQLLDSSGRKLAEQSLRVRRDPETPAFRFQWRPEDPGLAFYRLRVGIKDELRSPASRGDSEEVTLINNTRVVAVDRARGPYRVLYVAGRPNWEYKFLNRALQEDDQLQLVGLIRVAQREPKFEFRGRAGETSNPLFRGFSDQSREQVERYDQPVLVRLNTLDELELRSGFPRAPEELYRYHAVILDDLEAGFFTPDQAVLLQKFVSERGGGLLMLGGTESFREGNYQHTPIGDMLPIYLDHGDQAKPPRSVRFNLTREGWLQPWARLRNNEADEKTRLEAMPAFQVLNPLRDAKPGACVVATATDETGKEYPALITQRFGRGRTVAMPLGDVWRWGFQNAEAHRDMDKAWRQLVRWLVADVPKRVELTLENPTEGDSSAVEIQVRVRDPKFQPMDDATVTVEVQPVMVEATNATTGPIRLRAEPSLKEAGLYEITYIPRNTGGYKATACVTNSAGAEVGRAEAGWSTDLTADELRSVGPNVALLETIARKTGGEIVPAASLETFVRKLPQRPAPITEPWSTPVWHSPFLFVFAMACLLAEWGLRRWKGMP
jgi:uncharacterized membrane protein